MDEFRERKDRSFDFEPRSTNSTSSFEDMNTPYYGTILGEPIIREIEVWTNLIAALNNGLPKPFDNSIILQKIIKLEKQTNEDLSHLKNCCPPSAEVREAKDFKPFIFAALDRIVEIGEIGKYVEKHK